MKFHNKKSFFLSRKPPEANLSLDKNILFYLQACKGDYTTKKQKIQPILQIIRKMKADEFIRPLDSFNFVL
jgi:hypothetical protein